MYTLLGGVALAVALFMGGWYCGGAVKELDAAQAEATRLDRVIVRIKKERVVEERVITKWRDRKEAVAVKEEAIKNEIPVIVRADCVLPADFSLQLHAISRNATVADTGFAPNEARGADCRSVLAAVSRSYANHYRETAQLNAILDLDEANASP